MQPTDETKRQITSRFVTDVLHLSPAETYIVRETWMPVGETTGYLGSLHKCLLVIGNTEPETHSFIAKFDLPEDNPLHEFAVSNHLFKREVAFYESTKTRELKVPLYYFSSSSFHAQKYLVIEDLTSVTCTPRFELGCTYEQCVAVITELAKVHSFDAESPLKLYSGNTNSTLQDLYQSGVQGLVQCTLGSSPLLPHQWKKLTHQLPDSLKTAYEDMHRCSSVGKPRLHITHGDLWSGNVLFSSVSGSASQLVAIVDWQFAQLEHCPISDLITFLSSSVDTRIRQQNSTALLSLYLDSRSDLCKEDAEYDFLKQIFSKHFLTLGTAFAVASWEIFKTQGVACKQDNQCVLLNRFWDLLTDYCNSH